MNDTPEPQHHVVSLSGTIAGGGSLSGALRTRFNLAVQHMLGAARFSRMVAEIEGRHKGQEFDYFWDEIFQVSMACVFSAVASVEAYANELFADREQVFPGNQMRVLDKVWELYEQKRILEKFDIALCLKDKEPIARGSSTYQEMQLLIDLRNSLIHFKPEWIDEVSEHRKLSNRLRGKRFSPSPFLDEELIFPRRWATHGCTSWAVNTALHFSAHFEALSGLPPKYSEAFRTRLRV